MRSTGSTTLDRDPPVAVRRGAARLGARLGRAGAALVIPTEAPLSYVALSGTGPPPRRVKPATPPDHDGPRPRRTYSFGPRKGISLSPITDTTKL